MSERKTVIITADGACSGNGQATNRAAAAAILEYCGRYRAVAEYIGESTNQRAEIIAVALGLESLNEPCDVIVRSDSRYVIATMNGEFRRKTNLDCWQRLDQAAKPHRVAYEWIRGHNGDPQQEAADKIARSTAESGQITDLILDHALQSLQSKNTVALDYTASRPDGTTISELRGLILTEQATIEDLESRLAGCRQTQAEYICRLSQTERNQIVAYMPNLFPNGLPNTTEIPFIPPRTKQPSHKTF